MVNEIEFDEPNKKFISCSADETIKIWTLNGELIQTIKGHHSYVSGISIENNLLVSSSGGPDNSVKIWSLK